jgi:tripartite-type tricarboxylate transporter receptor subunit TctC
MIVPYPAGGPTDTLARILSDHMKFSLGQSVIIENITGAGGSLGVARVARAPPDGYTLSIGHWNTHVVHGATMNLPYDVLNDFAPVALLADTPIWLVARNTLAPKDFKELLAWLKLSPGTATAGTVGVGGASDVNGAYFQNVTGTKFQFVPYRGAAPLNQDLLAGHIDIYLGMAASSYTLVRAGQVKAYAVMAKERWWAAPEVPTMEEEGVPGLEASFWHGLCDRFPLLCWPVPGAVHHKRCTARRDEHPERKSLRTSPAQMSQDCARLAAQVKFIISEDALLYSSYISLSSSFSFCWRFALLVLLPGFFDGDV